MCRNREQRLGQLANIFHEKVLDVLACKDYSGFLFADTFHEVSDIFYGGQIGEEKVKFIDTRNRIPSAQKLLGHIRKDIEQQSIADIFARLEKSFHAERYEPVVGDIGVSVKEFTLRTLAKRVQSETDIL